MTATNTRPSARTTYSSLALVAVVVFGITQIPFLLGSRWAPRGSVYDGLVGMIDDQNMSYSFIRQASEGDWLFVNRLTHLPHKPALLNLEWLAVGRMTGWLNGSDATIYTIWRLVGTGLLLVGFWQLAAAIGLGQFERRVALWMCAFGGGFGWVFLGLERTGLTPPFPEATLDLSDAIHPFSHIFANPHLSVSHGLSLLFLAAYVAGESSGRVRWYVVAGGIAAIHGLVRPYDLIMIYGAVPLFILVERAATGGWSRRTTLLRLMPLLVTAPVLAYCVALFRFHPVFKYWASQGEVRTIGLHWHLLSFGLAGILFLARLGMARRYPLKSPGERFLLVWVLGALVMVHGKSLPGFGFIPFAPVFGVTLPSVMLVLGSVLIGRLKEIWTGRPAWGRGSVIAALVIGNALGSAVWILKISRNLACFPDHYITAAEHDAHVWLNQHANRSDVVLSALASGNRMAKYVSCRLVLGHWSVTPHVKELGERVERFYRGAMTRDEARALLDELDVRWIYRGPPERELGIADLPELEWVAERYASGNVQVFACEPQH